MPQSPLHPALGPFGTTVFAEMTALAQQHDAVNLGQGFPDSDGPVEMLDAACEAVRAGLNQYPPGPGLPVLRRAIADHQRRFYALDVDPEDEVLVTVGATEALTATILSLVRPGDEVVVLEPYYDSYVAAIALAGGVRRTALLRFPDFRLDEESLRAAFSERTRVVLLNTPHNPTGRVLEASERQLVADLAVEHDAWVVCDEVYEHLVFDGSRHVPLASLPGMRERTLSISSAGKTFSATGWKIGWLTGPAAAVDAVRRLEQFVSFAHSGPFQVGVAAALGLPDARYSTFAATLQRRRDLLVAGLEDAGLRVSVPQGTYFVVADASPLGATDAVELCRRMPAELGVAGVPVSAFQDDRDSARTLVRFAFCKQEHVLEEAVTRLRRACR